MAAYYDRIGINYSNLRKPDPRIFSLIDKALGKAQTVLNVGAGTGSYEPADRSVTAVEPSLKMIGQRPHSAVKAIQASSENLPFKDDSFDASMAILTVHHWSDLVAGLREMQRVTRGSVIILTFDPTSRPWLTDYLPELALLDETRFPLVTDYSRWLGAVEVETVPIPHDCSDGFLYAYWRRPTAYLDPNIRSGSSSFWALDDINTGLERLKADLETECWESRYAELLTQDNYDAGYRLVISKGTSL